MSHNFWLSVMRFGSLGDTRLLFWVFRWGKMWRSWSRGNFGEHHTASVSAHQPTRAGFKIWACLLFTARRQFLRVVKPNWNADLKLKNTLSSCERSPGDDGRVAFCPELQIWRLCWQEADWFLTGFRKRVWLRVPEARTADQSLVIQIFLIMRSSGGKKVRLSCKPRQTGSRKKKFPAERLW